MDKIKVYITDLFTKVAGLGKSRKFWALAASLISVYQAYATGGIDVFQALQLTVGALGAFSLGTAIEASGLPGYTKVQKTPAQ